MDNKFLIAEPLKPALASIRNACTYLGGVSRAKFYLDILPKLESVHLGARHFVVVASMDRLIATRLGNAGLQATLPKRKRGQRQIRKSSGGKGATP